MGKRRAGVTSFSLDTRALKRLGRLSDRNRGRGGRASANVRLGVMLAAWLLTQDGELSSEVEQELSAECKRLGLDVGITQSRLRVVANKLGKRRKGELNGRG